VEPPDIRRLSRPSVLIRLGREKHAHGHWSQTRNNTVSLYRALEQTASVAVSFFGHTSKDHAGKLALGPVNPRQLWTLQAHFNSTYERA